MPVFIFYKKNFYSEKIQPKNISCRVINETTSQKLYNCFSLIDANDIISKTDINDALIIMHNKVLDCYNINPPFMTK